MNRKVIVVSIEGVAASLIGSYGSNTAETKTLDSLAANGIVLDQCFLDSRDSLQMLVSLWTGQHALTRSLNPNAFVGTADVASASDDRWLPLDKHNLWTKIQEVGGAATFVTDCSKAAELAERYGCDQVVLVEPEQCSQAADESSQCGLFALFSAAAEAIENNHRTNQFDVQDEDSIVGDSACEADSLESVELGLCWIHSQGLRLPWDAPIELRKRFIDSDDPDPPADVGPPNFVVDEQTDPDCIVGWTQVAAAQVAVLDEAIDFLRDFLAQHESDWAWCFLGLNGYPLGEQGWVGWTDQSLSNHQLQAVCIFHPQPSLPIGWRVNQVCQLPDVAHSIAELCGLSFSEQKSWGRSQLDSPSDESSTDWPGWRQIACVIEEEASWLRTPAWSLRTLPDRSTGLFVQPDDRWEISEVSSRCREVVEELLQVQKQFAIAARDRSRDSLENLADSLCNFLR